MDHDDLRKVGTVTDEFCVVLLLESYADKAFRLVCIKLGIVADNSCRLDVLELDKFCKPWICLSVFLLEVPEVVYGVVVEVIEVVLYFIHLILDSAQLLIYSLDIELGDLAHRLLHELEDIFHEDRPLQ